MIKFNNYLYFTNKFIKIYNYYKKLLNILIFYTVVRILFLFVILYKSHKIYFF